MTPGAEGRRARGGFVLSLAVLAACGFVAYWTVTSLFAVELHQTGEWLEAKLGSLRW